METRKPTPSSADEREGFPGLGGRRIPLWLIMTMGETLTNDTEVAAVLTYIRSQWGNHASPVTDDQVGIVRTTTLSHGGPWTETELLAIPASN
jgi:hypothetical protein